MVKRMIFLAALAMTVLLTAGCGISQSAVAPAEKPQAQQAEKTVSADGRKILVVYFSWSGNSADMARYVQQQTGGDILELQPAVPYPKDYDECTKAARIERDEERLPDIANLPESISQYDTVLLGYPIWWHTAPMIIGTFLQHYDLNGVDIYPFVQSAAMEQVHFDNSMDFVRSCSRGAVVHDGLYAKHGNQAKIHQWLKENNLLANQ